MGRHSPEFMRRIGPQTTCHCQPVFLRSLCPFAALCVSRFTFHASRITHHVSRFTFHVHVSRFTPYLTYLTYLAPLTAWASPFSLLIHTIRKSGTTYAAFIA